MLTDALGALREADREAVLLRFYQDLSLAEVGEALGVSEEAARKRVNRGLDKLRAYLQRHDIPVTAALLANGIVVPISFGARRAVLLHSISQSAVPGAGKTVVSASAHQFTSEVLRSMLMTKLKITAACAVTLACAISGAPYVMAQGAGASSQGLVQMAKVDKKTTIVETPAIPLQHKTAKHGKKSYAPPSTGVRYITVRTGGKGKNATSATYKTDGVNFYTIDGKLAPEASKYLKADGVAIHRKRRNSRSGGYYPFTSKRRNNGSREIKS